MKNILLAHIYEEHIKIYQNNPQYKQGDLKMKFLFNVFNFLKPEHLDIPQNIYKHKKFNHPIQYIQKVSIQTTPDKK